MHGNLGFKSEKTNSLHYYVIPNFEKTGLVVHGFTSRIGGVSLDPYDTLNLGLKSDDDKENVMTNFKRISEAFNVPMDKMVLSDQVHGTNIKIVTEEDAGKGLVKQKDYKEVDGLLTDVKGIMLITFYADCVPLFFLDRIKKVIGVAHAGWKGTVARIGEKMIDKMQETYNSNLEDILIGIGPSIGSCCYSVREDVYNKFKENKFNTKDIFIKESTEVWKLDLWKANRQVFIEKGIRNENITLSDQCTSCNNKEFFSYRRDKGKTGRMAALIQLKKLSDKG